MLDSYGFWGTDEECLKSAIEVLSKETLIYNGALTDDVLSNVKQMLTKYPNMCEITHMPLYELFKKWQDDECPLYTTSHESCMGQDYTREQTLYGLVHKDFIGGGREAFIFFKSRKELDGFMERFYEHVIDKVPFKTILER